MENKLKTNRFIHLLKFIACLFVITIHAPFPGAFGDIIGSISRFAVPFFFAVSGRFLLTDKEEGLASDYVSIRRVVSKRLKKLLKTILIVYPIYLAYSFFWYTYKGIGFFEWLHTKYNLFEARIFLFFNTGRFIFDDSYTFDHMWYLFALVYIYALIILFAPVLRKWYKGLIVILIFFLFFGEALQTFYPIRPFDISIHTWYIMRNWLFVGMPFVLIGILFGDFAAAKEHDPVKRRKYVTLGAVLSIIGLISGYIERMIFGSKEVYIGSLLIVVGLLFASEFIDYEGKYLWIIGKEASPNIYYYHVLVIAILDFLSQNGFIPDYSMAQKPVIVIVLCIVLFWVIPHFCFRGKVNEQS